MIVSKVVAPKTKAELIRSLQSASFRSFSVHEGSMNELPAKAELTRLGATVIVLRP
jgi:hypothetical protein